jgi:hypothetical protein
VYAATDDGGGSGLIRTGNGVAGELGPLSEQGQRVSTWQRRNPHEVFIDPTDRLSAGGKHCQLRNDLEKIGDYACHAGEHMLTVVEYQNRVRNIPGLSGAGENIDEGVPGRSSGGVTVDHCMSDLLRYRGDLASPGQTSQPHPENSDVSSARAVAASDRLGSQPSLPDPTRACEGYQLSRTP